MKLPVKLALLASAAGFLATSAFAADMVIKPTSVNIVTVGGDAGFGVLSTPDQYLAPIDGVYITAASYQTGYFAGGANLGFKHAFTPNVLGGVEFGYDYNGLSKYTLTMDESDTVTYKINSWDLNLLATGTYLFNNGFNVFGKAGAARVKQSLKVSGLGSDDLYSTSDTAYKPMLAAGVGYQVKMVNFYVQYGHIFGKNAKDANDLLNADGTFTDVVSVNTVKAGVAVNIAI